MHLFDTIVQLKKMLENLDKWLETSTKYAQSKSFDPNVLLTCRLAPDQYPLVRQLQATCDAAKFAAARLSGKTPPSHPDTEQTMEEIRNRVRTVIDYLGTFSKADFDGADARDVALPFFEGKVLAGSDYHTEMVVPNFYFHVTTAYAILRHNGVALGKMDFLGSLNLR